MEGWRPVVIQTWTRRRRHLSCPTAARTANTSTVPPSTATIRFVPMYCPCTAHVLPAHLHGVALHCHNPLDEDVIVEEATIGEGRMEDHNVSGGGLAGKAVRQLLRDEPVADVEGGEHGERRDEARLGDEPERMREGEAG